MQFRFAFRILLGLVLLPLMAGGTASTYAFSIAVTRFDDPQPDGCLPDDCSLREAIIAANDLPGPDVIQLGPGTHHLEIGGRYEEAAATGDMDIADDLVITGAGADATIISGGFDVSRPIEDRVFDILPAVEASISGLSIAHVWYHFPTVSCGGGILNRGTLSMTGVDIRNNVMRGDGGGICNNGTLFLTDSGISRNQAALIGAGGGIWNAGVATLVRVTVSGNAASAQVGGGIYNQGTLTVTDSTVNGNVVDAPFGSRVGGGIANGGTAILTNVTVADNTALGEGGGVASGGTAVLTNVTIADNIAVGEGGGIYSYSAGTLTLTNTIVAGNAGEDCVGPVFSAGHNLDGDGSCGFTGEGDLSGADPMLGPLADHGGPTQTHALLPGSPAIDDGDDAACPDRDQRGGLRPQDGDGDGAARCDIGAYEAPPPGAVEIDLSAGWNLISLPLAPADTDPSAVLASVVGGLNSAWAYPQGAWVSYDPDVPPALNTLTAVDETMGIWLHMQEPAILTVRGAQPVSTAIHIYPGWNFIGYPAAEARGVTNVLAEVAYTSLWAYDPSLAPGPWQSHDPDLPPGLNTLQQFEPRRGYALNASAAGTVTIQSAPTGSVTGPSRRVPLILSTLALPSPAGVCRRT